MSTLAEVEAAVESLPPEQQHTLYLRLGQRLENGPTCYELTRELFEEPGHLLEDGPVDLSYNKDYLADYGRRGQRDQP